MLTIEISGWKTLKLEYLVLDVNGTLATDGELAAGVSPAVQQLKETLQVILLTADTFGQGSKLAEMLGVSIHILSVGNEREQKRDFIHSLGAGQVAAIGQGINDEWMLRDAALGICVLSTEGTAVQTLLTADVLARDGAEALALLLHPDRLKATLRR
jgi:P-type E1-E2 ATPase